MSARLSELPCPSCAEVGGVNVISMLAAKALGSPQVGLTLKLAATWRPVLVCDGCDLYEVGRYTLDGQSAVWGYYDEPQDWLAAEDEPVRTNYPPTMRQP